VVVVVSSAVDCLTHPPVWRQARPAAAATHVQPAAAAARCLCSSLYQHIAVICSTRRLSPGTNERAARRSPSFPYKERRAKHTTNAASSGSHAVRQLGLLAVAPPPGVGQKRSARQPAMLARGLRAGCTLCAPQEAGALPALRSTRCRELAAADGRRGVRAEGAARRGARPRPAHGPQRRRPSQQPLRRPGRRAGTRSPPPRPRPSGPFARRGGRPAPMRPAGDRASAALFAAPLLLLAAWRWPALSASGRSLPARRAPMGREPLPTPDAPHGRPTVGAGPRRGGPPAAVGAARNRERHANDIRRKRPNLDRKLKAFSIHTLSLNASHRALVSPNSDRPTLKCHFRPMCTLVRRLTCPAGAVNALTHVACLLHRSCTTRSRLAPLSQENQPAAARRATSRENAKRRARLARRGQIFAAKG
jgi:hypothetical protein